MRKSQPTFGDKCAPCARAGRIDIKVKTASSSPSKRVQKAPAPFAAGFALARSLDKEKTGSAKADDVFERFRRNADCKVRLRLSLNCGRSDFCWVCLFTALSAKGSERARSHTYPFRRRGSSLCCQGMSERVEIARKMATPDLNRDACSARCPASYQNQPSDL